MSFVTKQILNTPQKITANSGTALIADTINFVNTATTTVSVGTSVYGVANVGINVTNPIVTTPTTVGVLLAAATAGAGARSFVTDATATTFLSIVVGGGANGVPVVSNGTSWLIG
jgi:hypothetical protein